MDLKSGLHTTKQTSTWKKWHILQYSYSGTFEIVITCCKYYTSPREMSSSAIFTILVYKRKVHKSSIDILALTLFWIA
jgi:hypothetical protein